MSYPYFFLDKSKIHNGIAVVSGKDFVHLSRVLRAKKGDHLEFSDNEEKRYCAVIENIGPSEAVLKVISEIPIERVFPQITLFLSILKKDAMDIAIQKTVEMGITRIVPVISKRVVIELKEKKKSERIIRWQQIAENAAKQCKRDFIADVLEPVKISAIDTGQYDLFFVACEDKRISEEIKDVSDLGSIFKMRSIKDVPSAVKEIAYLIGPEGGFDDTELSSLIKGEVIPVNFGSNILRAETAALYFLSILDFLIKSSL